MICTSCQSTRCDNCRNNYDTKGNELVPEQRNKTWCDCQHKTGVYIHSEFCKHYLYVEESMESCPSCGMSKEMINDQSRHATENKETPTS